MCKRIFIAIFLFLPAIVVYAGNAGLDSADRRLNAAVQIHNGYEYSRPRPFTFAKQLPGDVWDYSKQTFRKDQFANIAFMVVGTAALVAIDQPLYDGAYKLADHLHLSHENRQRPLYQASIPIGSNNLLLQLNVPFDATTSMYFLGDGIIHFSIAGAFWVTGLVTHDYRALQTSSQLLESILATGFAVQLLKHITGHEDPYVRTAPGGVWRLFPNQADYAKNVPHYDAFPSGHLATAMATITVIANNYEEYRYIRPVGYTLMGFLGYAMLNNGVHWASDYPLGIALGYAFAKIAINKGRTPLVQHSSLHPKSTWNAMVSGFSIKPGMLYTGDIGLNIGTRF